MLGANRQLQITQNPPLDLAGSIQAARAVHRPALSLNRLPELLSRTDNYTGRELTRLAVLLTLNVFVRSSELRFARWDEFDLQRAMWEIPDTRKPIEGVRYSTRGTKMSGDIQIVPLSPQVIEILERLRSLNRFSELVLPVTTGTGNPCRRIRLTRCCAIWGTTPPRTSAGMVSGPWLVVPCSSQVYGRTRRLSGR